jgi:BlaI family transcriptional regulator, penicillinase repressor
MNTDKPTESELEILQILWQKTEATVREVHEILQEKKQAGYTTTLKLMQIMLEKGLVKRNDDSRTHIYQPAINQEKTQKQLVNKFIEGVFGGSRFDLVMKVLGDEKSSATEIEKIKEFLDKIESNNHLKTI